MVNTNRSTEHILVIETDPIQGESLRAALEYCGYTCETAGSAAAAFECFHKRHPDAIIVDPGVPDCDGIELISMFRFRSQVPIIVLSRRSGESDKVAALDKGADDYVQKPFHPGELVARLKAKLRLFQNDHTEQPTGANGEPKSDLTRMERALLSALVKHQGATVPVDEIIAAVWGPNGKATNTDLRVLVFKLRRKLDLQKQPLYVLQEFGAGYYVAGWVELPRRTTSSAQVSDVKLELIKEHLRQQSSDLRAAETVQGSQRSSESGAFSTQPVRRTMP